MVIQRVCNQDQGSQTLPEYTSKNLPSSGIRFFGLNMYQCDGKRKVWQRKETAHDPKRTTLCVKHSGCSVMALTSVAAIGTSSLAFIGDVTVDRIFYDDGV